MESRAERKSVRVTIYNQPYTLGVTGEPGEVEALAHSVDELMTGIAHRAGNVDAVKVAVLACLELADRTRGLELELEQLRSQAQQASAQAQQVTAKDQQISAKDAQLKVKEQELAALKAHVHNKSREFSILLDEVLK